MTQSDGKARRKVTLDTNVLVSYIISKKDNSVVKAVVTKSIRDDSIMITDIIRDEVLSYADKHGSRLSREDLQRGIDSLDVPVIVLSPPPSKTELQRRYGIRDINDGKILYSVEMTDSVILVTYDDDFFDGRISGLDVEVMDPTFYLYESDIRNGKYNPERETNRRHLKIARR